MASYRLWPGVKLNATFNTQDSLEHRLEGTRLTRFLGELVGNSALFPILDGIRSLAADGLMAYFLQPAHYALVIASVVQAWYLGHQPRQSWRSRFGGNLIGVSLYLGVELLLEGWSVFNEPYHWVYIMFSLTLACLNAWQAMDQSRTIIPTVLLNIARVSLLPAIYFVVWLGDATVQGVNWANFMAFLDSGSHQFIVFGTLFFGILIGLAEAQVLTYTQFLRWASQRLKAYSEWSLDSQLIETAFSDEKVFHLRRVERSILFMDIRGFTAWTEKTDPDEVVRILNQYYTQSEAVIAVYQGHKPGFAADEVMTRFEDPLQAVQAAKALQAKIGPVLASYQLSVGIGIHTGPAMEGLLGSDSTKKFDIIGDTVNTAKRLESAAGPGEVIISAHTYAAVQQTYSVQDRRNIQAKGKSEPLTVFSV